MPRAVVCINTDFFAADIVLAELRECENVEEAFRVYGVYDVIAKVRAETTEKLLDFITEYIKSLPNVQSTHTMLIVDSMISKKEERHMIV
ncbi:MAG: Lrp/AsnC family transcriptional regulator [Crenarchaeota archaeon]|nr:Lrp/AsnC family transcriptional regulator [Thermoproteota archaeon]